MSARHNPLDGRYALWIIGLISGLSGFCSLLYQVIWDRTVRYNFGGDSISSAIVSGTFLLGLGLGAWIFGRWRSEPFRSYALIEFAIGLFAIVSYYLIAPLAETLASVLQAGPDDAEGIRPAVVAGCILLLLPPCTLIGGTLPLMFRCFIGPGTLLARRIGLVYGLNTLGAGLGIVSVPLLLLNRLSLPYTLTLAGCVNIALGVAILWLGRRAPAAAREPVPARAAAGPADRGEARGLIVVLAFVSGLVAIGFEVSLFRAFQVVNPSSAYNFPAVLVPFLLALAAGSIVFTRGLGAERHAIWARAGVLLAAGSAAMLLAVWASSALRNAGIPVSFRPLVDGYGGARTALYATVFALILVTPVPLLTGAIFPLLLRLRAGTSAELPSSTGQVYLVNSAGAFTGALLGKFAGFPLLGTRGFLTLLFAAGSALGLGVWAWARARAPRHASGLAGVAPAAFAAAAVALALAVPAPAWRTYVAGAPDVSQEVREGVTGVAQIRWNGESGDVLVNGQYMSRLPDHPRHVKQSVFLLAQPARERVLLLGLGGGGIVRTLVADPAVREIWVVDWSHELPGLLAGGRAGALLDHALASPKVRILRTDARVAVTLFDAASFDLVFDNLAFASWVGSTAINTEAYFRKIRRLLRPHGVFVKGANYSGSSRLAVLAGLVRTFEHVVEHAPGEVVVAATAPPAYADSAILEVMTRRAPGFGARPPYLEWFRDGFAAIPAVDLQGVAPMREDLLIHEYFWRPFARR